MRLWSGVVICLLVCSCSDDTNNMPNTLGTAGTIGVPTAGIVALPAGTGAIPTAGSSGMSSVGAAVLLVDRWLEPACRRALADKLPRVAALRDPPVALPQVRPVQVG
jgi:hypothetical protein